MVSLARATPGLQLSSRMAVPRDCRSSEHLTRSGSKASGTSLPMTQRLCFQAPTMIQVKLGLLSTRGRYENFKSNGAKQACGLERLPWMLRIHVHLHLYLRRLRLQPHRLHLQHSFFQILASARTMFSTDAGFFSTTVNASAMISGKCRRPRRFSRGCLSFQHTRTYTLFFFFSFLFFKKNKKRIVVQSHARTFGPMWQHILQRLLPGFQSR